MGSEVGNSYSSTTEGHPPVTDNKVRVDSQKILIGRPSSADGTGPEGFFEYSKV